MWSRRQFYGLIHGLLALFFYLQGVAQLIILSTLNNLELSIPIVHTYIVGGSPWNPTTIFVLEELFKVPLASLTITFILFTGTCHLGYMLIFLVDNNSKWKLINTSNKKSKDLEVDELDFKQRELSVSFWRWIEYSISSTLMILSIFNESGINDLYANITGGCCNVTMILCGIVVDKLLTKQDKSGAWEVFGLGCVSGLANWVAIFTQIGILSVKGSVPGIVFAITIVIFLFFFTFAIHDFLIIYCSFNPSKHLSCCCICPASLMSGSDYLNYKEMIFMWLSFISKSILSWLVCGASFVK